MKKTSRPLKFALFLGCILFLDYLPMAAGNAHANCHREDRNCLAVETALNPSGNSCDIFIREPELWTVCSALKDAKRARAYTLSFSISPPAREVLKGADFAGLQEVYQVIGLGYSLSLEPTTEGLDHLSETLRSAVGFVTQCSLKTWSSQDIQNELGLFEEDQLAKQNDSHGEISQEEINQFYSIFDGISLFCKGYQKYRSPPVPMPNVRTVIAVYSLPSPSAQTPSNALNMKSILTQLESQAVLANQDKENDTPLEAAHAGATTTHARPLSPSLFCFAAHSGNEFRKGHSKFRQYQKEHSGAAFEVRKAKHLERLQGKTSPLRISTRQENLGSETPLQFTTTPPPMAIRCTPRRFSIPESQTEPEEAPSETSETQ